MTDYVNRATYAITNRDTLTYMGMGALGGGLAATFTLGSVPSLSGRYATESLVVGALSNMLMFTFYNPDTYSTTKAVLSGAVGQWLWYRWLRAYASGYGLVA